jgi:hypothetical protein
MSERSKVTAAVLVWAGLISTLHFSLNVDWATMVNDRLAEDQRKLYVAYIPVT